jgi:hypothetical protein
MPYNKDYLPSHTGFHIQRFDGFRVEVGQSKRRPSITDNSGKNGDNILRVPYTATGEEKQVIRNHGSFDDLLFKED